VSRRDEVSKAFKLRLTDASNLKEFLDAAERTVGLPMGDDC
jgi:hypothetical protein